MNDQNCRGCGVLLTDENDSEAHIIPNALGGRLKPRGILCRTCNTRLDELADNALVAAFGSWPTLLDIPRDRGNHPPKTVPTEKGKRVRVERDGSLTASDVSYSVSSRGDEHLVEISAGDMKTFRQLLNRAKKQFPQIDVAAAEAHARVIGVNDDDRLKMGIDFSPAATFGGLLTAIWLFLILKTGRAFLGLADLERKIAALQAHGGTFRYFTEGLPGLVGPDIPFGHKLVIRSVPSSGLLIAYVEILGVLRAGGIFAAAGGPSVLIEHVYAYDLVAKSDRSSEFSFDASIFEAQDWNAVGIAPTEVETLKKHLAQACESVFETHYRNRFSTEANSAPKDAGAPEND